MHILSKRQETTFDSEEKRCLAALLLVHEASFEGLC